MKIFLESCKETSKLSGDVFWGRWDRMVAQKVEIKIFFFEKLLNPCNPPWLPTCVILALKITKSAALRLVLAAENAMGISYKAIL